MIAERGDIMDSGPEQTCIKLDNLNQGISILYSYSPAHFFS